MADLAQASAAGAPLATSEGRATALETQASALGTAARRAASSSFGDYGERQSFAGNRAFGTAGTMTGETGSATPSAIPFALGEIDASRELGGLVPVLGGKTLADPAVRRAVRNNAATAAIHNFAQQDALREIGARYFGSGQAGERAFAGFAQHMVQWKAFGDEQAHGMLLDTTSRHFEGKGYSPADARLKASGVIADASADPVLAKVAANAFDQEAMLRNEMTNADIQLGAMEGRRDAAGQEVAATERDNVATEQQHRRGYNQGQREAASMLGLSLEETSRRIAFISALSGEARSTAIMHLSRATGRNEAQVAHALETYAAETQLGAADGATAEVRREASSVYGRTRDVAGYDVAERAGKLDAERELGHAGTRSAARVGEQRHQADAKGFAEGAAAAGMSVRQAAHLDSFLRALSSTAGNQADMAEGGPSGVADRARNEQTGRMVEAERLTRIQGLLRAHGISIDRKRLAVAQNGDLALNVTTSMAGQLHRGGLINDSQYGAIAAGGHARFSFAANDLLVSSSTGFEQSARHDSSTKFEAGKQAGPDTIEHFLGGGDAGHAAMANWLRGGFEMDRKGEWRLKPQVADTLERDVTAMIAQTGWSRSINRSAQDQVSQGSEIMATIGSSVSTGMGRSQRNVSATRSVGKTGGSLGFRSSESGTETETASGAIDIVNFEVRDAIAAAERQASRSSQPEKIFSASLTKEFFGQNGLRNRYLEQADAARSTFDLTSPITSGEQSSVLARGRFSTDFGGSPSDEDSTYKKR